MEEIQNMSDRTHGRQFAAGNKGGPGRPRRAGEREYLAGRLLPGAVKHVNGLENYHGHDPRLNDALLPRLQPGRHV